MKLSKIYKISTVFTIFLLCCGLLISCNFFYTSNKNIASASSADNEIYYQYPDSKAVVSDSSETIKYHRKVVEQGATNAAYPDIINCNNANTNSCAPVAGANVITYYDRFFTELIPNVTPGHFRESNYLYYPMHVNDAALQGLVNSLYIGMGTNTVSPGTTQPHFQNGLQNFVNSKNLNISFVETKKNGVFNYANVKDQINAGKPIVLYLSDYQLAMHTIAMEGEKDNLHVTNISGNHIMVAFGYMKLFYYDTYGNLFRTELFLRVSSGLFPFGNTLFRVYGYGNVNAAEGINIY